MNKTSSFSYFILHQHLEFWASLIFTFIIIAFIFLLALTLKLKMDINKSLKVSGIISLVIIIVISIVLHNCYNDYQKRIADSSNAELGDLKEYFNDLNPSKSIDKAILGYFHVDYNKANSLNSVDDN
ncbi:hypothetical protein [Clostridium sp. C8-1-8]|uniref:hypothetical protein n=1 Tax=Clostridium sp. C8-1-8 TaxID=2698831 RepID=UPI00136AC58D|nr:hypothetical protein [Clostridium sp. C8-1-8]